MRLSLSADSPLERIGLALKKVPTPAGRTFNAMAVSRTVGVAQRIGLFTGLLAGAQTSESLAARLGLRAEPTRMVLDLLTGEGLLEHRSGAYSLSSEGRRWLDPAAPTYIGTFIEHTASYWEWWADLERVLRGGDSFEIHQVAADDPSWPIYIRGQYELARLSAGSVAKTIDLAPGSTSVLDLAGGHGWFAAAICQRTPGVSATVVDLAGSVAVGVEIIRETGMSDRVRHEVGDMFTADLGGPHDLVLCFSILHHLTPEQTSALLARARAALRPGGRIAILDMFHPGLQQRRRSSAAIFELFFHLTSGVDTPNEEQLQGQLQAAGFGAAKRHDLPTIPDLRLYVATASGQPSSQ